MNTPPATPERSASRRRVPFLGHQIAEYVVAVALIAVGFHMGGGAEVSLLLAGFLIAVLNVLTAGPIGALSFLSRRAHHVGDFVVAAVLVVTPIFFAGRLHLWGVVLSEATAVLVVWMERATQYGSYGRRGPKAREALSSAEPGVIESAGIVAGVLALEAARASRKAAHNAGLVAGITRRVVRQGRAGRQPTE